MLGRTARRARTLPPYVDNLLPAALPPPFLLPAFSTAFSVHTRHGLSPASHPSPPVQSPGVWPPAGRPVCSSSSSSSSSSSTASFSPSSCLPIAGSNEAATADATRRRPTVSAPSPLPQFTLRLPSAARKRHSNSASGEMTTVSDVSRRRPDGDDNNNSLARERDGRGRGRGRNRLSSADPLVEFIRLTHLGTLPKSLLAARVQSSPLFGRRHASELQRVHGMRADQGQQQGTPEFSSVDHRGRLGPSSVQVRLIGRLLRFAPDRLLDDMGTKKATRRRDLVSVHLARGGALQHLVPLPTEFALWLHDMLTARHFLLSPDAYESLCFAAVRQKSARALEVFWNGWKAAVEWQTDEDGDQEEAKVTQGQSGADDGRWTGLCEAVMDGFLRHGDPQFVVDVASDMARFRVRPTVLSFQRILQARLSILTAKLSTTTQLRATGPVVRSSRVWQVDPVDFESLLMAFLRQISTILSNMHSHGLAPDAHFLTTLLHAVSAPLRLLPDPAFNRLRHRLRDLPLEMARQVFASSHRADDGTRSSSSSSSNKLRGRPMIIRGMACVETDALAKRRSRRSTLGDLLVRRISELIDMAVPVPDGAGRTPDEECLEMAQQLYLYVRLHLACDEMDDAFSCLAALLTLCLPSRASLPPVSEASDVDSDSPEEQNARPSSASGRTTKAQKKRDEDEAQLDALEGRLRRRQRSAAIRLVAKGFGFDPSGPDRDLALLLDTLAIIGDRGVELWLESRSVQDIPAEVNRLFSMHGRAVLAALNWDAPWHGRAGLKRAIDLLANTTVAARRHFGGRRLDHAGGVLIDRYLKRLFGNTRIVSRLLLAAARQPRASPFSDAEATAARQGPPSDVPSEVRRLVECFASLQALGVSVYDVVGPWKEGLETGG